MNDSRVFSIKEQFNNIIKGSRGFVLLRTSRKQKLINKKFKERIMLAITEVNGCEMCSYMHTRIALSSGMTSKSIKEILGGDTTNIPLNEAIAVMFAQEFADTNEKPTAESINRITSTYGYETSALILAACYMITMTNGMGTSLDYLYQRLRFKRNKKSNILTETINPLLTMVLFPILTIYNFTKAIFGFKPRTLNKNYAK